MTGNTAPTWMFYGEYRYYVCDMFRNYVPRDLIVTIALIYEVSALNNT